MSDYQKVIAAFKAMNFRPKVDEFQDRLIVQKVVYLLQLKGFDTHFLFKLHIRGPYSHPLADSLYSHREEFENLDSKIKLNSDELREVGVLQELFGRSPSLLEVAATYAYFYKEQKCSPLESVMKTKEMKKTLSESKIAVGISKVKEYLFPPSQAELDALKKEMAIWQNASVKDSMSR